MFSNLKVLRRAGGNEAGIEGDGQVADGQRHQNVGHQRQVEGAAWVEIDGEELGEEVAEGGCFRKTNGFRI